MMIAQRLYESGRITYMRTDSVNLSSLCINASTAVIKELMGERYVKSRQFHTKTKGAQEAHEAIRPTYMDQTEIEGTPQERRLYDLIWKRTVASQMADAEIEKTTATIQISGQDAAFVATGEVIKFDGFLKVYRESFDEDSENETAEGNLLPRWRPDSNWNEKRYKPCNGSPNTLHATTKPAWLKNWKNWASGALLLTLLPSAPYNNANT